MNILDNELVDKYFECECNYEGHSPQWCDRITAENILTAMQEPIKKGERYLRIVNSTGKGLDIDEDVWPDTFSSAFHGFQLRLPDRFQKKKTCTCGESEIVHRVDGPCFHLDRRWYE